MNDKNKIIPYISIQCDMGEISMLFGVFAGAMTCIESDRIIAFALINNQGILDLWNKALPPKTVYAGHEQAVNEDAEWGLGSEDGDEEHAAWTVLKKILESIQGFETPYEEFFLQANYLTNTDRE